MPRLELLHRIDPRLLAPMQLSLALAFAGKLFHELCDKAPSKDIASSHGASLVTVLLQDIRSRDGLLSLIIRTLPQEAATSCFFCKGLFRQRAPDDLDAKRLMSVNSLMVLMDHLIRVVGLYTCYDILLSLTHAISDALKPDPSINPISKL
jgi:hypothetical protein